MLRDCLNFEFEAEVKLANILDVMQKKKIY